MSTADRIASLLVRMRDAAADAHRLTEGVDKTDFMGSIMLNRSVGMSLLMASEVAAQIIKTNPDFVVDHPEFPWQAMRGMRNRIAHNYFDINLQVVWDTARNDVPDLVSMLDVIIQMRIQGE